MAELMLLLFRTTSYTQYSPTLLVAYKGSLAFRQGERNIGSKAADIKIPSSYSGRKEDLTAALATPPGDRILILEGFPLTAHAHRRCVVRHEPQAVIVLACIPDPPGVGALILRHVHELPIFVLVRRRRLRVAVVLRLERPNLIDKVPQQVHGHWQVVRFAFRVCVDFGIHICESGASKLNLRLRRGAGIHSGIQPERREVVPLLFVNGPRVETQRIQPLGIFRQKSACPMPSILRQVHISVTTAGHG